ncbi:hypothetical protein F4777DRAFT_577961 [Nemania sp. FL0916]|nr:hypothetical protein F4777DRAFT_577961 [Nemania sp. FL0916]
MAAQRSGTRHEAITGKQMYYNIDPHPGTNGRPSPPRPPTPGPPRPNPPIPPTPPVPTPPPSPRQLPFCDLGPQVSILISRAEPSQCPYPNPPPSPGPRRPGPLRPRPNVPSPPPSPHRSINPWIFSTASSLAVLVLEYISSATWDAGTAYGEPKMTMHDTMYSQSRIDDTVAKATTALPALPMVSC